MVLSFGPNFLPTTVRNPSAGSREICGQRAGRGPGRPERGGGHGPNGPSL